MDLSPATWDEYFMNGALWARGRANCLGSRYGALLVRDKRVLATGYNGTGSGRVNCLDGGCARCTRAVRGFTPHAMDLELCVCIHAEMNAMLAALRHGVSTEGADIYITSGPCFQCAKALLQAGVRNLYYLEEWVPDDTGVKVEYIDLLTGFEGVYRVSVDDPARVWANRQLREREPGKRRSEILDY